MHVESAAEMLQPGRLAGLGRCCGPRPGPAVVCAPGSRPGASRCSWSFPSPPNATHVATRPTYPPRLLGLPGRPFLPAPVPGPAARLSPSGHGRGLHPAGPLDMGGRSSGEEEECRVGEGRGSGGVCPALSLWALPGASCQDRRTGALQAVTRCSGSPTVFRVPTVIPPVYGAPKTQIWGSWAAPSAGVLE